MAHSYEERIAHYLDIGFSRAQARGHPGAGEKPVSAYSTAPTTIRLEGTYHETYRGTRTESHRVIHIDIRGQDRQRYELLKDQGRDKTALHFLLGAVYGGGAANALVGGPYDPGIDYDDPEDYPYYEEDLEYGFKEG